MGTDQWAIHIKKSIKHDPCLTPDTTTNLRWIADLNVKC